jgi:predicted RNA-binding Zn ribbon-like protein
MAEEVSDAFEILAGDLAVDFVNTLDGRLSDRPVERLERFDDLLAFLRQAGAPLPPQAPAWSRVAGVVQRRALRNARTMREALARTLWSAVQGRASEAEDLRLLSTAIAKAHAAQELTMRNRALACSWCDPTDPNTALHLVAVAIEGLIRSGRLARLKKCAAEDCGTLFVDTSRAGQRRWCDMKTCGNRDKVRRFRHGAPAAGR